MSLMNNLVRRYIRRWDKELQDIADHPSRVQCEQLQHIINSPIVRYLHPSLSNYGTEGLTDIKPTTYSDIAHAIKEMMEDPYTKCRYYAQSSGTTSGVQKLIPTPEEFVKCNHLRGSWYLLHTLYSHDQSMSVFKQKNLLIGGSLYKSTSRYTIGDVSGIMISRIPSFFRPWYVPSIKEAVHPDWKKKLRITSDKASKEKDVALLAGTPIWVLSVLRAVLDKSEKDSLTSLWPHLKAYIHGGVDFGPYRSQFDELVADSGIRYIEVYNASEGFFAYQDRQHEDGMLLMLASGIYYEFIEESDYRSGRMRIKSIADVELDVNYVMIITTLSGLVRYIQGDIIRFVTKHPNRVKVVSRIESYINAFGEDLLLNQVQKALAETNRLHSAMISQFHIAPSYISINTKGRHDWYIEWKTSPEDMTSYALDLDKALMRANPNYAQKREADIALEQLKIIELSKGITEQYFRHYSHLSAQSKLQRMRNDRLIAERLEELIKHKLATPYKRPSYHIP